MPSVVPPQILSGLAAEHAQNKAFFEKTGEAMRQTQSVLRHFDKLSELGEAIQPEDVTKAAGHIVGHGISAKLVAGIMAGGQGQPPMPQQGGVGLASWVEKYDDLLRKQEAQLSVIHEKARHATAVSALHLIAAHSMPQQQVPQGNAIMAPPSAGAPNAIAPGAGGLNA